MILVRDLGGTKTLLELARQRQPAIAGDFTAVEIHLDTAALERLKLDLLRSTIKVSFWAIITSISGKPDRGIV